jgi:hypothetical protein
MKTTTLIPQDVVHLPDRLEEGVLYISKEFSLTAHLCCCGCGEEVTLQLNPARWSIERSRTGAVSLSPSVGNWKYACRSHYWIKENRVIDAGPLSARVIEQVMERDQRDRDAYVAERNEQAAGSSWWQSVVRFFRSLFS